MTLTDILSIGIALAFTYTVISMLASIVKEAIAAKLQWRAKDLQQGISKLLSLDDPNKPFPLPPNLSSFLQHPLITTMSTAKSNLLSPEKNTLDPNYPSYLPARYFTLALLDVLSAGSQAPIFSAVEKTINDLPAGDLKTRLLAFANEAGGDIDKLKTQFDSWFDDAMDRVSGAYKRRSQLVLLIIGAALAIALNVDTIKIVGSLQHDALLRNGVVAHASTFVADPNNAGPNATPANLVSQLSASGISIGWTPSDFQFERTEFWPQIAAVIVKIAGLALTAVAVSLGAPFWFDLLNQLVNIRSAGPKPPRADDSTADTSSSSISQS